MKNKIIPSVQKAIDFVKSNITNGVWKNGDAKLPSCKDLAAQAGIGYVGMVTAIKILQKEKVITARRNAGIYAGQQIPQQNILESSGIRTYKWQTIREKIKYDILEGRFHENEFLPGFKTLIEIYETHNGFLFRRAFQPLFRKALKIKGRIAWVCADDYLANYAALQFLKDENIKIPDQIGIVGFNDQVESLVNGITSYNFNFSGMALRALNFILYPNDKQWKKDRKDSVVVSIKGMVIDRGSV